MMRAFISLVVLALLAPLARGQAIRNYTAKELYPGEICADDGTPWEGLNIGDCPQGYDGIRKWVKAANLTEWTWPPCDPCPKGLLCYQFKPGVGKCTAPAYNSTANVTNKGSKATNLPNVTTLTYLKEDDLCLDFSNGKSKWAPINKDLFSKACEWPYFSCNMRELDVYYCDRVRDKTLKPAKLCYRAAGSRWWGGTDQAYYFVPDGNVGQFKPCGGPNPDYPRCPTWCKA